VDTTNKGDEPARTVRVVAGLVGSDTEVSSASRPSLAVNESYRVALRLGPPPALPGVYTIVVKVRYTDINGHPFTALAALPLVTAYPDYRGELLAADLSSAKIAGEGQLLLELANQRDQALRVRATLILPPELACVAATRNLTVAAGRSAAIPFTIENVSAHAGSTYMVFAVADCVQGEMHRSLAVPGFIRITAALDPFARYSTAGTILAAVLLVIFVAVQVGQRAGLRRRTA
jgi:hypothetical protein